jgi:hypothetical protein
MIPNVVFFVQNVTIPGISSESIPVPSPTNPFFAQGDRVQYETLNITFIIDEEMKNYEEIYNWIHGYAFPQDNSQYREIVKKQQLKSDISLTILNSTKKKSLEFQFVDCFPLSLESVNLSTTQTDLEYPQCSVSFQYDYYKIIRH